ncbi:hypothetical protein [Sphingobium sufflavum]|uniref:hypothetical protein n=1 Tax=Sphingobium sufflavum TaxID=1129547 RepID=UPI001F2E65F3|nr:hypothetical protein [Sphingobium sufflavum]
MSVHQRLRAQGRERNRLKSATIAGLVTVTCLIAVPVELVELILASIGLSELLPVLAPPIGWPVRIVLALIGAAIAAVIVAGRDDDGGAVRIAGVGPGMKGNGIMGWTRSLGLHHLARLARGGDGGLDSYPAPLSRGPVLRSKREAAVPIDFLARNRRDMHPDAPPRAPLVVSRDLPGVTELTVLDAGPDVAPPPPVPPCASPIRDTTSEDRPRPLPRSPAPLSDSDLSWVRGLLAEREAKAQGDNPVSAPVAAPVPSVTAPFVASAAPASDSATPGPPSLLSLVDRFEQGVAQRVALRDAANAMDRVEESLTGYPVTPITTAVEALPPADDERDVAPEVDVALNAALETLRKLSAKAR